MECSNGRCPIFPFRRHWPVRCRVRRDRGHRRRYFRRCLLVRRRRCRAPCHYRSRFLRWDRVRHRAPNRVLHRDRNHCHRIHCRYQRPPISRIATLGTTCATGLALGHHDPLPDTSRVATAEPWLLSESPARPTLPTAPPSFARRHPKNGVMMLEYRDADEDCRHKAKHDERPSKSLKDQAVASSTAARNAYTRSRRSEWGEGFALKVVNQKWPR